MQKSRVRQHPPDAHMQDGKSRWTRAFFVPVAISAALFAGRFMSDLPASNRAGYDHRAAVEANDQSNEIYLSIDSPSGTQDILKKDVASVFVADCCEMAVLQEGSHTIRDLLNSHGPGAFKSVPNEIARGDTLGTIRNADGSFVGFSLVLHPHDLERGCAREEARLGPSFPWAKPIDEKAGMGQRRSRGAFLNLAVHEASHAALKAYSAGRGAAEPSKEAQEFFAVMSELAYGGNCWHRLYRIALYSSPPAWFNASGDDLNFYKFFSELLRRLTEELGIRDASELPGKSETEIRNAAQTILDRESIRLFGVGSREIISASATAEIRSEAAAYFDSLQLHE